MSLFVTVQIIRTLSVIKSATRKPYLCQEEQRSFPLMSALVGVKSALLHSSFTVRGEPPTRVEDDVR